MVQTAPELIATLTRTLAADYDLTPVDAPHRPVFLAMALPRAEGVTGLKPRLPSGRGLSPQQAMVSAGAEALELRASLAMHHQGTLDALPREDGLAMVAARDLATGADVPVPAQSVYLDAAACLGEPLRHDANSTGCATGPTLAAATESALRECIERDALALWWHGGRPARPLPLDLIDRLQPRLCWWLDERKRKTRLLDITTDIGCPVTVAVSSDADGRHVALGASCHADLAQAALSAVTEMIQTEAALDMARQAGDPEAMLWDAQGSTATQPQFRPQGRSTAARPAVPRTPLLDRLAALGHRALAVELTLPDDPLPSVRVLVPGLCAMGGAIDTPRFRRLCPDACSPHFPEPY